MSRPSKPALVGRKLKMKRNRSTGINHSRGEIKSEQQAACTLNHKCHEHQAAKAVKKTNVRRDIFSCGGVNKALSFNALLEPIERDEKRIDMGNAGAGRSIGETESGRSEGARLCGRSVS